MVHHLAWLCFALEIPSALAGGSPPLEAPGDLLGLHVDQLHQHVRRLKPCEIHTRGPLGCTLFSCCSRAPVTHSGLCGSVRIDGTRYSLQAVLAQGVTRQVHLAPVREVEAPASWHEAPVDRLRFSNGDTMVRVDDTLIARLSSDHVVWHLTVVDPLPACVEHEVEVELRFRPAINGAFILLPPLDAGSP